MAKMRVRLIIACGACTLVCLGLVACAGSGSSDVKKQYTEVDAAYVKEHMADSVIVDVRTPAEYDAGHIPGAINVPYDTNHSPGAQCDDLADMLEEAGVKPEESLVLYCRTGVRAAHAAEALMHTPYKNLVVYTGSWADWSADPENPIER